MLLGRKAVWAESLTSLIVHQQDTTPNTRGGSLDREARASHASKLMHPKEIRLALGRRD